METYLAEAKVILKQGILDVQGKTVEKALKTLGINEISNVRIGKYITFLVKAENSQKAFNLANDACDKLLYNPNIETYEITIIQHQEG